MDYKDFSYKLFENICNILPLKNIIVFESAPIFSDNSRAVFDEIIKRKLNEKYHIIWYIFPEDNYIPDYKTYNFEFIHFYPINRHERISKIIAEHRAKLFICCNRFLIKKRKKQICVHLFHGCPMKKTNNVALFPKEIDYAFTMSKFMAEHEKINGNYRDDIVINTGFARNDWLFDHIDCHEIFKDKDFKKIVYWMPTYRQHKDGIHIHSSKTLPIMANIDIAKNINDVCAKHGILLLVKPHFAQDVSYVKKYNLSNICFIDDNFLLSNKINNYKLLGSCDALITDYSSVFYDYLLAKKPIGLCWDDIEEYRNNEGFVVDVNKISSGSHKIYNEEDFKSFLCGLSADVKFDEKILNVTHDYIDNLSSKRCVDEIEKLLITRKN